MRSFIDLDIVLALLALSNVGAMVYFATTMMVAIIALWRSK